VERERLTFNGSTRPAAFVPKSPTGAAASDDYRNEPNTYGWIVEVDPYRPGSAPIKRTALGRFRHEGCWPGRAIEGQPLAFYSGDDARGEYIYKFVTADNYSRDSSDGSMLDTGTLYAARFNDDGSGDWLELSMNVPALASEFSSLAEILINTRTAADIVGATPMDRPEWGAVNPANGEVYMTLTNSNDSNRPVDGTDAANPRSYDADGDGTNDGNRNGHIIRWREAADRADATAFEWDIFLFGSAAGDRPENLSNLDETNAFASPDGLWFDSRTTRGVIWIQTDDSSLRDFTNNQMLAAIAGQVGDGGEIMAGSQQTIVGRDAAANQLRRFLTGPTGCEITGVDVTPDGTTMFINIQHPGGEGNRELLNNWPAANRDATENPVAVSGLARPRPATVVITRTDGGVIGA
ncbi:MAG: alkaline phosphatase PhoX, partial [Myxococcota bacterium]